MSHFTERRIEAHIFISFLAYKIHKEFERIIAFNKIGRSVDKVFNAVKIVTTIKVKMPENDTFIT